MQYSVKFLSIKYNYHNCKKLLAHMINKRRKGVLLTKASTHMELIASRFLKN